MSSKVAPEGVAMDGPGGFSRDPGGHCALQRPTGR